MSAAISIDQTLATLEKYIDLGLAIVPIWGITAENECACPKGKNCTSSKGKHPDPRLAPNGVKNATRDKTILREWVRRAPRGNWAVRTGEAIVGGGYLLILDKDPRNGGDESLRSLPELPESWTQLTGQGAHYAFRTKEPPKSGSLGPGLDLQGVDKYILVDPSKHYLGGEYVWEIGKAPWDIALADAPEWLLAGTVGTAGRPPRLGDGTARDTVLGEAFALAEMIGMALPDGAVCVKCPWSNEHSDARGRGQDSSTVILPPAGGSNFGGFRCLHSHCVTRKWTDVLNALPPSAVEQAKRRFPLRPVAVNEAAVAKPVPGTPTDPMQQCKEKLSYKTTKGGEYKVVNDIVNLITILSYDPRWKGGLRYNDFAQALTFTRPPPWHPDDAPKSQIDTWTDADVTRMDAWLRRHWGFELKEEAIGKAAHVVGRRDSFNPLRDWLESLQWDGIKRLDKWTATYLGTVESEYNTFVGAKWCISAIARAYEPGCKADHVLILEGPQGRGKSTALATLAGKNWFTDTPLDIGNKDAYLSLRGKWIIELAELASLRKAEADRIKAFFSSPCDYYRPPYGHHQIEVPRTCVFAGSVNHGEYLRDETGNRRYWPVHCGVIDIEGLDADREQLWAEAVVRYKAKERWWPELNERPMLEGEQEKRQVDNVDVWEDEVKIWLSGDHAKKLIVTNGGITTAQILKHALGMKLEFCDHSHAVRIGRIMSYGLGWQKKRQRSGRQRDYLYAPPGESVVSTEKLGNGQRDVFG